MGLYLHSIRPYHLIMPCLVVPFTCYALFTCTFIYMCEHTNYSLESSQEGEHVVFFFLRLGDLACIHFKSIHFSSCIFCAKYLTVSFAHPKNGVAIRGQL